jgi:hypothetical protein
MVDGGWWMVDGGNGDISVSMTISRRLLTSPRSLPQERV